jgi:hypothetical protein
MNLTLHQIVEMATQAALDRGALGSSMEQDFPAKGKAYRDLTDDEFSLVMSIAMERHRALNWLCGYGRELESVPLPT